MDYDLDTQLEELDHWEWMRRMEAVRRLELIGDQAAVPQLAERLRGDESQYVRAAAARGLGRLDGGDAVDALVAALEDKDFHVRQAALWALSEVGAAAEAALPAIQPFTESRERFTQAEMTVAELAEIVVSEIEFAVEKKAEAEAEAKRKAEEEVAAKRQAEAEAADVETAAEAEAVAEVEVGAEATVEEAEEETAAEAVGESAEEARLRRRQEALARKREMDKLRAEAE